MCRKKSKYNCFLMIASKPIFSLFLLIQDLVPRAIRSGTYKRQKSNSHSVRRFSGSKQSHKLGLSLVPDHDKKIISLQKLFGMGMLLLFLSSAIYVADAAPSLSIVKTLSTTGYQTGSPGANANFKIVISNTGEDCPLNSVVLTDLMPNGITFTGATPTPTSNTLNPNGSTTITWNIGTMNSGDPAKTIYPRCVRNGKIFGPLKNNAIVTGKDQTGRAIANSSAYNVLVLKPDIKVTNVVSPTSSAPCGEMTFVINLCNTGNDTFSSLSFSDLLPKGIDYVSEGTTPLPNSTNTNSTGITNLTWNNLGYMGIGGSKTITLKARMSGEAYGQLITSSKVAAKPPRDYAYYVTNISNANVLALRSSIRLSENVSPSSGSIGADTDFTINISNTGEVPLSLKVIDTIPEGLTFVSCSPAGSEEGRIIKWNNLDILAPGSSTAVHLTARVNGQRFGTLVNHVAVIGRPLSGGCDVTAEDAKEVAAHRAGLQINQTPYPASCVPGGTIDFRIDITNTGDVNLNALRAADVLPKGLRYSSASIDPTKILIEDNGTTSVTWDNIISVPLVPNASTSIHLSAILDENQSDSVQNKMSAIGLSSAGFNVTGENWKNVTVLKSAIHVVETPIPDTGSPGTLVDFKIDTTNTGEVNMDSLMLVDLLPEGLRFFSASINPIENNINANGTTSIVWGNILDKPLVPGASLSTHLIAVIDGTQSGSLPNKIRAIGTPPMSKSVTSEDEKIVTAFRSAIQISLPSTPESGSSGTSIDFKISVTNTGELNLSVVKLVDLLPKGLSYSSASINPTEKIINANGSSVLTWENILTEPLAPNSSVTVQLEAIIDGTQSGSLQNIVTVTGTPLTGSVVTDKIQKNIEAYVSGMRVDETLDPDIGSPGTIVDFKIYVENTGKVNLNAVSLVDLLPKGLTYSSASAYPDKKIANYNETTSVIWNNIIDEPLAPNATATIQLAAKIDGTKSGSLKNCITAIGTPPTGYNVTAENEKNVTVVGSAIQVTETPTPNSGCPGASIDFKIDVTNSGQVDIDVVKLVDLLPKGLKYVSASVDPNKKTVHRNKTTSVTWNNILAKPLESNESTSIHLVATLDGTQSGSLQNIVTAIGTPLTGYDVTSKDQRNVTVIGSAVLVTETPTPDSGRPGTSIDFKIDVINSGQVDIDAVKLVDLLPKGLKYSSASTDPNKKTVHRNKTTSVTWNNILAKPLGTNESKSIHLVATIDGTQSGSLKNVVTAIGTLQTGYNVTAREEENITASRSAIQVIETLAPESGTYGTAVDFKIDVINTGEVNIDAVKVVDLMPKGLKYSSASIKPNKKTLHHNKTTSITWNNILTKPLGSNESASIHLVAVIDGTQSDSLQNIVTAIGRTPEGINVTGKGKKNVTACLPAIRVAGRPTTESGSPGIIIGFNIDIINSGAINLDAVKLVDLLPKGLTYSSSSVEPALKKVDPNGTTTVEWSNILDLPLAPNSSTSIHLKAKIDGTRFGTLQNRVTSIGVPSTGSEVTGKDQQNVTAYKSGIKVVGTLSPSSGNLETAVDFKMELKNTGETNLDIIKLVDTLPKGLNYTFASIDPDSNQLNSNGSRTIGWNNILDSPLSPGSSKSFHLNATVDGTVFGKLQNEVMATGKPQIGDCIYGNSSATLEALQPIWISIIPTPGSGAKGTNITFDINITNLSNFSVSLINIADSLPDGLKYVSSDPVGSKQGNTITWSSQGELAPGRTANIKLVALIDGGKFGELKNSLAFFGIASNGYKVVCSESKNVHALTPMLSVSKTASKKVVNRGEEISYTIRISNTGGLPVRNVQVRDVFDSRVDFISASPMPDSNGVWHFSVIEPNSSVSIILTVRVPVSEINFNAGQRIAGNGFVNIANRFSTTLEQYYLNNQVHVTAEDYKGFANERVSVSSSPGTELKASEHGSGSYSNDEILKLYSKNRSIEVEKNLSARSQTTNFSMPRNRLTHFRSKWQDRTSVVNQITGTSIEESYRQADRIEHHSKFRMDRNGTDASVISDFEGEAVLRFLKSSSADNRSNAFESSEQYGGRFRIHQDIGEYGEEVRMNRSAKGIGFVNADKHVRQSQRTYELGQGDYQIEELIDTPTSFMNKRVNLTRRLFRYDYLPGINTTASAGWKEGMWSKTKGTGHIKEEFEDIARLKKETTANGLNGMNTAANFSGRARFSAISGDSLKLDQVNNGDFSIKRKLLLKGVSRFDRSHISVTKEGEIKEERINDVNVTVAEYKINVLNDGNTALSQVRIRDIFPPGTEYINSSIKPVTTDFEHANWTLMGLGIGSTITINLWLKAKLDSDLVNRVDVAGEDSDKWVTASNLSFIENNWLGCHPDVYLTETARIDPLTKTVVWYYATLKNSANSSMTAVVTDHIPSGMRFLNSSLMPSKQSQNEVKWTVKDIAPGECRSITYRAQASRDGKFTDLVHVDASRDHGQVVSAEASADVVIGPAPVKMGKSLTDSSRTGANCSKELASDYNLDQGPTGECSGPCPAFREFSDEDIP